MWKVLHLIFVWNKATKPKKKEKITYATNQWWKRENAFFVAVNQLCASYFQTPLVSHSSVFFWFWQMKSEVKYIRGNLSLHLWTYTQNIDYLNEEEWTDHAWHKLLDFENSILDTMKIGGWDGVENPER